MAPKKRKLAAETEGGGAKKAKTAAAPRSMRITRNMTTDGPRQAVFNTAELLEGILLELPMKQLFTIRRVSQQFRDGVNTSVKLQEKMFLRPRSAEKESWTLRTLEVYPNERWHYTKNYEFVPSSDLVTNVVKNGTGIWPAEANPLIGDVIYGDAFESAAARFAISTDEYVELKLACLRHPGSWQDMYLTDPPCTQLAAHFYLDLNTKPAVRAQFNSELEVSNSDGLTVKIVLEALMENVHKLGVNHHRCKRETRETSINALMAEMYDMKKSGHMIKKSHCKLRLSGVVLPSDKEWEEVRRKSKVDESEADKLSQDVASW